ncbi:hypothetical protein GCM10010156_52700 [Planobispora rosea]|uniref:Uncharacterized protein n=1 Tax=Planobispora rosea TaxID=35762 RepID=A0A8J3WFB0_PLARO|nr:hypothetical protein [Planobispora rosea]GGS87645.1 hypothetical protein GCM10010156_52700 [Planobispora rosea]GIH86672.1 hypothetical protein Pro02_50800 [Planobispora rosea]
MDIGAIRDAIADAVRDAIPRLNCFGYCPDSIPEPCFYVGEVDIEFDQAFGRGLDELMVTCRLLVSRSDDRAGQAALDRHLAGSGPHSIKAALGAARGAPGEMALGGLADDVHLQRVQGYRMYQVGDTYYYGAELVVRVIGGG